MPVLSSHSNAEPAGTPSAVPTGRVRPGAKVGALLLLLLVLAVVTWRSVADGTDLLSKEHLQQFVAGFGLWAPAAHVLLYAAGATALVPATLFSLIGAVVFGTLLGSLLNVLGATGTSVLAFLLARSLGRDAVRRWMRGRLQELDVAARRHGFILICYLRLAYLPLAPVSYAAGLSRIRFRDYFLGTLVGLLPETVLLTYFMDELTSLRSPADLLAPRALLLLTLLALSWLLPVAVRRAVPMLGRRSPGPARRP